MKDTWKLGVGHTQQVAASLPGLHDEDPAAARLNYPRRLEGTLAFTRAAPLANIHDEQKGFEEKCPLNYL